MSSYPTKLRLFKAWAKAMEEGATVDKPSYRGTTTNSRPARKRSRARPVRRRRKRGKKAQD